MTSQSGVGQTRIVLQFGHADLPTSLQAFGSSIRFRRWRRSNDVSVSKLAVGAVFIPAINHEIDLGDVAFGRVRDRTEDGVPGAGLQGGGNLAGLDLAGLGRPLAPYLERRIRVERVSLRIDVP